MNKLPKASTTWAIGLNQLQCLLYLANGATTAREVEESMLTYPEIVSNCMRRLIARGMVVITGTERAHGGFSRRLYAITPTGSNELARWARQLKGLEAHVR